MVAFSTEMLPDTRIFYTDGRKHIGASIHQYLGDSRARWEGEELVVETTNLTDKTAIGVNGNGVRHSTQMVITERFRRVAENIIQYQATYDDPVTYEKPFTVSFPLTPLDGGVLLPYDCHPGNAAISMSLSAERAEDRAVAADAAKGINRPRRSVQDDGAGVGAAVPAGRGGGRGRGAGPGGPPAAPGGCDRRAGCREIGIKATSRARRLVASLSGPDRQPTSRIASPPERHVPASKGGCPNFPTVCACMVGSAFMTTLVRLPLCTEVFDNTHAAIVGGEIHAAMGTLRASLRELRAVLPPDDWTLVGEQARRHSLHSVLLESPFTRRAYEKPRGYAGDAVLMDLIYGFAAAGDDLSPLGGMLYGYEFDSPCFQSVRTRRAILAREIDSVAAGTPRRARAVCGERPSARDRMEPGGTVRRRGHYRGRSGSGQPGVHRARLPALSGVHRGGDDRRPAARGRSGSRMSIWPMRRDCTTTWKTTWRAR